MKYTLTADLVGSGKDQVTTEVQICRPQNKEKFEPQTFDEEFLVGGLFGKIKRPTKSEITVSSSVITPGEPMTVSVNCFNSNSRNSIDIFKFKLCRRITYNTATPFEIVEYLQDIRSPFRVEAFTDLNIGPTTFTVPAVEGLDGIAVPGTVETPSFSIKYYMRCFMQINSVFEIGQGTCVEFPVIMVAALPTATNEVD